MAEDSEAFSDAYWALLRQEPIEKLVEYLRRIEDAPGILVLITEALDPNGVFPTKLVLSKRGRGPPRRLMRDVSRYRSAAARANAAVAGGDDYLAAVTDACDETKLSPSEMKAWMAHCKAAPLISEKRMAQMRRWANARGSFEVDEKEEMAVYTVALRAVRRINEGVDMEEELLSVAAEAGLKREEMHGWIKDVAEAERWRRFNSLN